MAIKRIVIIFIIAFCLLSFIEIFCLAKEADSPSRMWKTMDENNKISFILGVKEGMEMCIYKLADWLPAFTNKDGAVLFFTILEDHEHFIGLFYADYVVDDYNKFLGLLKTIAKIVSDLYKDPANTYIPVSNMCLLASRKLRGKPIESLLEEFRGKALR